MFKALLKLFSGSGRSAKTQSSGIKANGGDLEGFVEYVVRALVDAPDEVRVCAEDGDELMTIKIYCRKDDIGKIVGKHGKTIMAIRSLVSGAAGRLRKRITVEVVD